MSYQNESSFGEQASLFQPKSWMAKIEFIDQVLSGTNGVLAVVGEQSSGKTSFSKILKTQTKSYNSIYINVSQLHDDEAFIQQVAQILQLESCSSIRDLVHAIQNSQTPILLIIDDAQFLSESLIRKLLASVPSPDEKAFIHFCLVGTPRLWDKLTAITKEHYSDRIHFVELGQLNEQETKEYIVFRLMNDSEYISKDTMTQFYQLTEGHIDGINTQMHGFFRLGQSKSTDGTSLSKNKTVPLLSMITAGFVIAVGIGLIFKPSEHEALSHEIVEISLPAKEQMAHTQTDELNMISSIPAYDVAAVRQFFQYKNQQMMTEVRPSISNNKIRDRLVPEKLVQHTVTKHSKVVSKKVPATHINQDHFTIQIIASKNLSELKHFAQKHGIYTSSNYSKVKKKGSSWYVLTLGDYQDHAQAKKAIQSLPSHLSQFKPWVRKQDNLQNVG